MYLSFETKTYIKNFLRKYLPSFLYKKIYSFFSGNPQVNKYVNFIKSGFYDFYLDDLRFKIFLDPDNGVVDNEIFAHGSFESDILRLIKSNLNKDSIFIDIGANIGQHSLFASYFCKKVYSFEPITKIYNQFNKSIYENNILNIQTFNYAIGYQEESKAMYGNNANIGASSLIIKEKRKFIQNIKILNLDKNYKKIGIDRVDFIKIDVEGYEWEVLRGIEEIINNFSPKILLEFSPYLYNQIDQNMGKKIYDFLVNKNYKIFDIGMDEKKKIEIKNFDDLKNLNQTNLFCLR